MRTPQQLSSNSPRDRYIKHVVKAVDARTMLPSAGSRIRQTPFGNLVEASPKGAPRGTGMIYKGEWNANTQYRKFDVVNHSLTFEAGVYIAIADSQNKPPTEGVYWTQIARLQDVWV